jgi:transaldolase
MSTRELNALGQRLWLDTINRELLDSGALLRYASEYSITGLTSNPSIFDAAVASSSAYDAEIRMGSDAGLSSEAIFTQFALADLCRAADLFRPLFDTSDGLDGWVSMEVSPLLATNTQSSIEAARHLHQIENRPNLMVKIPGTPAGNHAIEASIHAGIPVNVTLLFSLAHYQATADAYLRALERRLLAGLSVRVASVASIFISRWDVASADLLPPELRGQLGITVGRRIYAAYRELLTSARWRRLASAGARPQRLLWASTGNKDPDTSPTRYVDALVAPDTINTVPEKTLLALARDRHVVTALSEEGYRTDDCLAKFRLAGVNIELLAQQLQHDGVEIFVKSWDSLLRRIAEKSAKHTDARNT